MSIQKLRTLARELAGEAWDYERRQLAAQAYVRRTAAKVLMTQADSIQGEDAMFEDPQAEFDGSEPAPPGHESRPRWKERLRERENDRLTGWRSLQMPAI